MPYDMNVTQSQRVPLLPRKIAIVRALQLGDMLCAVPALRALRHAFPDAQITLVGLPWAQAFAQRFSSYIDAFIEFPGFPGLPERAMDHQQVINTLAFIQQQEFDLVLQLHGSGSHINEFVALMGAKQIAAFHLSDDYRDENGCFVPWPAVGTEAQRLLCLIDALNIPRQGDHLEFPLGAGDFLELTSAIEVPLLLQKPYVCIHPGARFPSRRWSTARFAAVGDALGELGMQVFITGTSEEKHITDAVLEAMHFPATDLAGKLTLGAMAALLYNSRLLVANDTGVSHVAAGVGALSVIIASGSDAARWQPHDHERNRYLWHDTPCRPCSHIECPIATHPCASAISHEEVISTARDLVAQTSVML